MKNKKILSFLFVIFCLLPVNIVFGEEIIFETPEIEKKTPYLCFQIECFFPN